MSKNFRMFAVLKNQIRMNIKDYQEQSRRSCAQLNSTELNLSHMVLGLSTELPELQDAVLKDDLVNIGEELTDIMWYSSNYHSMRGYELELCENDNDYDYFDLVHTIGELQDQVKKYIAYGREIDTVVEKSLLTKLSMILYSFYRSVELDQMDCLQKNIDKLIARSPEKFKAESFLTRDLDKERRILEG